MVKLRADFGSDWIAQLRSHLIQVQGWDADEVKSLDNRDVRIYYFESLRRRLALRARVLKVADDWQCPPGHEAGWKVLRKKVRDGKDLNPHLSKGHSSLLNRDGLLAEWGVHHFHLGTEQDPKNSGYMKRTGPLVYALVDDDTFCAINTYPHGNFEDSGVVESIHRNWPDLISRYRVRGVTAGTWDKTQRRAFRAKNANVNLSTADGTVYMPISGGVMASGVTFEAVQRADYWLIEIQNFQASFEKQLSELLPVLEKHGYTGHDEIEAKLQIVDIGYQVFFPKYDVVANVTLVAAPNAATGMPRNYFKLNDV
jgi:hypothetical protein